MRRPGSGRQIWPPWVSPASVRWKSPGLALPHDLGVVGQEQAQRAGPALQRREHRRQVVVAAVAVVHAAELDGGAAVLDGHGVVEQQTDATGLDGRRST